jgi:hypothetical protein
MPDKRKEAEGRHEGSRRKEEEEEEEGHPTAVIRIRPTVAG